MTPRAGAAWPLAWPRADGHTTRPWLWALALATWAATWLALRAYVAETPPYDNLEQLSWLRSLEWGYYKHPPLPTWLAWAAVQVFGPSAALTYVLGAALTLVALSFLAAMVREALGPRSAQVAVAAALCMAFYSQRLHYYNHNTLLMLWVAVSAWLSWRLLHRPRLSDWALLGLVAGLGLLTKYQYVLAAACVGWLFLALEMWRSPLHRVGAALAAGVALLVVSPHLWWLAHAAHTPLDYARDVAFAANTGGLARAAAVARWAADWGLNRALPAWLFLLALAVFSRSRPGTAAHAQERTVGSAAPPPPVATRVFFYSWALLPPLVMLALGLVGGAQLQTQWAAGFAFLATPAVLLALRLDENRLRRPRVGRAAVAAFVLVQALLMAHTWDRSPRGLHPFGPEHWCRFPAEALAAELRAQALPALGGRVRLISGPAAPMQALALHLPGWPRVLIERNPALSPWVAPGELADTPVLELWPPGQGPHDLPRTSQGWGWQIVGPVDAPLP
jgi:4-amino-4-deoxy-L-arabinose transferase-like glycosyltransferase